MQRGGPASRFAHSREVDAARVVGLATPGSYPENRAVGFELVTDLCTESDVLSRPALQNVTLSAAQLAQIPGYIEEASTLVCGYLGHTYGADETVPNAAVIVTARAVARALVTSPTDPNVSEYTRTSAMGNFSATSTAHVAADVLGGGVWLTRQDKMALDSIGGAYSRMTNVALYQPSWCPPAPPDWWLMTPAPGGSP